MTTAVRRLPTLAEPRYETERVAARLLEQRWPGLVLYRGHLNRPYDFLVGLKRGPLYIEVKPTEFPGSAEIPRDQFERLCALGQARIAIVMTSTYAMKLLTPQALLRAAHLHGDMLRFRILTRDGKLVVTGPSWCGARCTRLTWRRRR